MIMFVIRNLTNLDISNTPGDVVVSKLRCALPSILLYMLRYMHLVLHQHNICSHASLALANLL